MSKKQAQYDIGDIILSLRSFTRMKIANVDHENRFYIEAGGRAVSFDDCQLVTRKLTAAEQADLPVEGWINAKVDTRFYIPSFTESWEVDADTYQELCNAGVLCQRLEDGRYIVTNG